MKNETQKRLTRAVFVLLALGGALLLLLFVIRPPCLISSVTGFLCAGCGGQRMALALLRGDFPAAFHYNGFLLLSLPLWAAYIIAETVFYVRGKPPLYRRRPVLAAIGVYLLLAVVFSVLRNLPGFEMLRP